MSVTGAGNGDIESRAWRSVFQDGLWDIALGITFFGVGLSATLDLARGWAYLIYAVAVALTFALLRVGKQRITIPRLGWVKFGPAGERRRRNTIITLVIGAVLMTALIPLAILMRSSGPARWTPMLSALAVATVVWAVLSLTAMLWGFPRLYIHALIIAASFFALESLGRGWPMLAGSVIVLAIGISYLVRFLKLYPKPYPEVASANS
jgi:hypothetical protein